MHPWYCKREVWLTWKFSLVLNDADTQLMLAHLAYNSFLLNFQMCAIKKWLKNLEWEIYTLDNLSKALNSKPQKIVPTNGDIQPHTLVSWKSITFLSHWEFSNFYLGCNVFQNYTYSSIFIQASLMRVGEPAQRSKCLSSYLSCYRLFITIV